MLIWLNDLPQLEQMVAWLFCAAVLPTVLSWRRPVFSRLQHLVRSTQVDDRDSFSAAIKNGIYYSPITTLRKKTTYPSHDGYGFQGEESRISHFVIDDAVEHFLFVVPWERRLKKSNELTCIFLKFCRITSPTSISKMRTPRPHQSTARVYDVSVSTSGARNSGVPQKVPVRSP